MRPDKPVFNNLFGSQVTVMPDSAAMVVSFTLVDGALRALRKGEQGDLLELLEHGDNEYRYCGPL